MLARFQWNKIKNLGKKKTTKSFEANLNPQGRPLFLWDFNAKLHSHKLDKYAAVGYWGLNALEVHPRGEHAKRLIPSSFRIIWWLCNVYAPHCYYYYQYSASDWKSSTKNEWAFHENVSWSSKINGSFNHNHIAAYDFTTTWFCSFSC